MSRPGTIVSRRILHRKKVFLDTVQTIENLDALHLSGVGLDMEIERAQCRAATLDPQRANIVRSRRDREHSVAGGICAECVLGLKQNDGHPLDSVAVKIDVSDDMA